MENITDLTVTQIRIFPVDVIPLGIVTTKSCVEKIRDALSVGEIEARPFIEGKNIIIFRRGELKTENELIVVNKIEIDPRRIIIEVGGTSKEATQVYEVLLSSLAATTNLNLDHLRMPLLIAETTRCVVALDFTFNALLSNAFIMFLNSKVEKEASDKIARGSVRPMAVAAEITYQIIDKALIDNNISMNPKQFTIAPRPGAPSDAKKYVISSPFDSDTHLKLIARLNKAITGIS